MSRRSVMANEITPIHRTSPPCQPADCTPARRIDKYAGIVDELNQVKKTSVDYYAAVRSLYRQKRKAEIQNGSTLELPPIPELGYDATPEDFDQPLADVALPETR